MSLKNKSTPELVQIASAGAGFVLEAKMRSTAELVQIATAASKSGVRVTFEGLNMRSTAELVQIGRAGSGCVVVAD